MANWFETITKTLADEKLSRRQAMKKAAGITAAVAMAAAIPAGEAFAATPDKFSCPAPGTCSTPFNNCEKKKNPGLNCYCFEHIGKTTGVCGCNTYCSSAPVCSSQSGCASGYACVSNTGCGCSTGLCIQKCTKTCVLSSNGAGRTAA
ncbi:MAG: hypothetical protein ACYDER_19835 [Ktedonobacteraceae bacterium]